MTLTDARLRELSLWPYSDEVRAMATELIAARAEPRVTVEHADPGLRLHDLAELVTLRADLAAAKARIAELEDGQ